MSENTYQSPYLSRLAAVLDAPKAEDIERFKADGWAAPLWMTGSTQSHPNGQVAIRVSANKLDGVDHPVLFAYVDEAQARAQHPEDSFIHYPLAVMGAMAQQQSVDLALVDGDEHLALMHESFLQLRALMALDVAPSDRDPRADERFVRRFEPFLLEVRDYCEGAPDVDRLHLVALAMGGAPMAGAVLLEAKDPEAHHEALQAMFEACMAPGDRLLVMGADEDADGPLSVAVKRVAPLYVRTPRRGWWARLFARRRRPQLVIVEMDASSDEA